MIHTFEDANILAVLTLSPDKFKITYKRGPTGRVYGEIEAEASDIENALHDISDNEPIGRLDFIKALKQVKAQIFSLKGPVR